MKEPILRGLANRCLQHFARVLPGAQTLRVSLHRRRGVRIGTDVFISEDVILETAHPELISIGDRTFIGVRVTVIAHMREMLGVTIQHDAFVGPGSIILPNVTIGHGAVVTAGSVVTSSVPPMTVVRGNPAVPVAMCGVPLTSGTRLRTFSSQLKPLASPTAQKASTPEDRNA